MSTSEHTHRRDEAEQGSTPPDKTRSIAAIRRHVRMETVRNKARARDAWRMSQQASGEGAAGEKTAVAASSSFAADAEQSPNDHGEGETEEMALFGRIDRRITDLEGRIEAMEHTQEALTTALRQLLDYIERDLRRPNRPANDIRSEETHETAVAEEAETAARSVASTSGEQPLPATEETPPGDAATETPVGEEAASEAPEPEKTEPEPREEREKAFDDEKRAFADMELRRRVDRLRW